MRVLIVTPDSGEGPWEKIMGGRVPELEAIFNARGAATSTVGPLALRNEPAALQRILDFGPDLVTAPNYNYWLLAGSGNEALYDLPVPVLSMWDDPLGALVNTCKWAHMEKHWAMPRHRGWLDRLFRKAPRLPAPAVFERLTQNPHVRHVAWDTGHAEAFASLGLDRHQPVTWEPLVVPEHFIAYGQKAKPVEPAHDVGFCGNIYAHSLTQHPLWQDHFTRDLVQRIVAAKEHDLQRSSWELLLAELETVPLSERREKGLTSDCRPFWELYLFVAWTAFNAEVRLRVLSSIRHDVHVFGLFADPASASALPPHLRFAGSADFHTELPRTYASIKINVCLTNGLIYRGTPSKLLECLASGGFALCDPKDDLIRLFGPAAQDIFFRDADELNAKIEYYLARPAKRAELVRHFQSVIAERCTLEGVLNRVLPLVIGKRRAA